MRNLLFIYFTVLLALPAKAQVGFGPEAGIGISGIQFLPPSDVFNFAITSQKPVPAYFVGGVLDIPMNPNLYFQTGLYFTRQGGIRDYSFYHNDSFNAGVHQELYIHYLDLPMSVFYKTGMQGKGRFVVGLGATLSYIVGGKNVYSDHSVINDTPFSNNGEYPIEIGRTLVGLNVAMNLIAGYELPNGLFFRARYYWGIKDIGLGTEIDKTKLGAISIGYLLGKGRNIYKEKDDLIDKSTDE